MNFSTTRQSNEMESCCVIAYPMRANMWSSRGESIPYTQTRLVGASYLTRLPRIINRMPSHRATRTPANPRGNQRSLAQFRLSFFSASPSHCFLLPFESNFPDCSEEHEKQYVTMEKLRLFCVLWNTNQIHFSSLCLASISLEFTLTKNQCTEIT